MFSTPTAGKLSCGLMALASKLIGVFVSTIVSSIVLVASSVPATRSPHATSIDLGADPSAIVSVRTCTMTCASWNNTLAAYRCVHPFGGRGVSACNASPLRRRGCQRAAQRVLNARRWPPSKPSAAFTLRVKATGG